MLEPLTMLDTSTFNWLFSIVVSNDGLVVALRTSYCNAVHGGLVHLNTNCSRSQLFSTFVP
jgi:hypothetical protein